MLTHYENQPVTERSLKSKGLVIEVDGVFHYPRNSEIPLGKNVIKFKALKALGYHTNSLAIPYYNWAILESKQRKPYLKMVIENAIFNH